MKPNDFRIRFIPRKEQLNVFAYGIQTACDKNGWVLDFTVNPGNEHDSLTFKKLYDKLQNTAMEYCVVDAGYKTPAITKMLLDDGVKPVFPYRRPMTKDGFFQSTSMFTMNFTTAISVLIIRCFLIVQRIEKDIGNTKAADTSVKAVLI